MSKTAVICSSCGKILFYTDTPADNQGKIASEVQRQGYVAKFPMFFGHSRWEFFCSMDCKRRWWASIPSDVQEEGNKAVAQFKEKLTNKESVEKLQSDLSRLQNLFNQRLKRK